MPKERKTYSVYQLASALLMIAALFWLTISAPFVYASQQQLVKSSQVLSLCDTPDEEESGNPLGNTNEEKKPNSGNTFSEEYLHNHHIEDLFISPITQFHKTENAGVYTAFHGEVQVPPPNAA